MILLKDALTGVQLFEFILEWINTVVEVFFAWLPRHYH